MKEFIEKAKEKINTVYPDEREWVSVRVPVLGWSSGKFDIELIVRPGSPCKGHILVNHGRRNVRGFDPWDKIIYNSPKEESWKCNPT